MYVIIKFVMINVSVLPYVKNPEENPVFSVHFTRTWQDTLTVSLHNFLALIYQVREVSVFLHPGYLR